MCSCGQDQFYIELGFLIKQEGIKMSSNWVIVKPTEPNGNEKEKFDFGSIHVHRIIFIFRFKISMK